MIKSWQKNDLFLATIYISTNLRSSGKILFKVGTYLSCLPLVLQVFNLDMLRYRRRKFNRIFQTNETNLKKQLVEKFR